MLVVLRSLSLAVVLLAAQGARGCAPTPPFDVDGGAPVQADAGPARDVCDDPDLVCGGDLPERVGCVVLEVGYVDVFCSRPGVDDATFARACRYACVRDGACEDASPALEVDVVRCE